MKNLLIILTIILVTAAGCGDKDYKHLNGKWAYNSKDGTYGEIWIDENLILFIDEEGYYPHIHEYIFSNDSISPLNYTITNYTSYIKSLNENKLILNDSYKDYPCFRISNQSVIENNGKFKDTVYKEFGLRFKKQMKNQ